jgi:hypothetical protein
VKTRSCHAPNLFLLIGSFSLSAVAHAASPREEAANILAAQGKLYCQRSFRTTGWVSTNFDNGRGYREIDQDPTDNSLCGIRSDGYAIVWGQAKPTVGPGLNGLPAVESTFFFGTFFLEQDSSSTPPVSQLIGAGRAGVRYYRWANEADICMYAKYTQMHTYWGGGGSATNPVLTWGHPGGSIPGSDLSRMKGKWWRWEQYFDSDYIRNTVSTTVYLKNVTDNTPEISGTVYTLGTFADGSTYTNMIHEYRDRTISSDTTPCTNRWMHVLVAKNLGPTERIPPAVELEGNTPGPAPAPAPTPTVDTTPPTVTIISPVSGSIVKTR